MLPANFTLYYFSADDKEEFFSSHFHNEIELVFPQTDGTGLVVNDNIYLLKRGYLYILNEHALHNRIEVSPSYERYNMYFDPQMLTNFSTQKINFKKRFSKYFYILNVQHCMEELTQIFQNLMESQTALREDDVTATICFLQLLKKLYDLVDSEESAAEKQSVDLDDRRLDPKIFQVHAIQNYINEHLTEPLTLDSISEEFFHSKYYLSHIFKKMTGYGVMEYVRFCRIAKACQMLQSGESVTVVSESIGLRNMGRFNRIFKSYTGMTPKQYFMKYASVEYERKEEDAGSAGVYEE